MADSDMREGATLMAGCLYMVAVPIGNVGDLSHRALQVLSSVDIIACEEVQMTRRLLATQNINAHLVSYRESGRENSGQRLIDSMLAGKSVAYVSGAGTPAISDPGRDLVERCHRANIRVIPIPGASALTAAIACAGLPCRRFIFEGFVPRENGERRRHFERLASEERTMVFYEAPHRLIDTVSAMLECWGERRIFLGRELTKKFEQCWLTDLGALAENLRSIEPRGEFVLVVEGAEPVEQDDNSRVLEQVEADLEVLSDMGLGAKISAELLCYFRGLPRNKSKRLSLDYFKNN